MKIYLLAFVVAFHLQCTAEVLEDPIQYSRSPLLTPADRTDFGKDGVWIPDTYGGVTGVSLDLKQVGAEKMFNVRFGNKAEEVPWRSGINYRVHADKVIENLERGAKERTIVLLDKESLKESGNIRILCYKIRTNEDRFSPEGTKLTSESTHYSLTISEITKDYEVLYLIQFEKSFPNSEDRNLTRPIQK